MTYETCDLILLCQGVLATTSPAKKAGVSYVFEPPVESFELETDVQRLQQILINLMSNANKFTEAGEIRLELKIDEAKKQVVFAISDTGCGIPEEKQEVVFDDSRS